MTGPYGTPGAPQRGGAAQRPPTGYRGGQPGPAGPRRRSGKLPLLIGALVLLVVAAAVAFVGFVSPGLLVRPELDAASVQQGVQQTLHTSYHLGAVQSVRCPAGQVADPGSSFECQVDLGGERKSVPVTVRDSSGVYEVGYPR